MLKFCILKKKIVNSPVMKREFKIRIHNVHLTGIVCIMNFYYFLCKNQLEFSIHSFFLNGKKIIEVS